MISGFLDPHSTWSRLAGAGQRPGFTVGFPVQPEGLKDRVPRMTHT